MSVNRDNEPTRRPKIVWYYGRYRIQGDLHPDGWWDWMIESENNGPVYWHRTDDSMEVQEFRDWMHVQTWYRND